MLFIGVKAGFAYAHAFGSLDSSSLHAHTESWPTAGEWPFPTSSKGISVKGENQDHGLRKYPSGSKGKIHLNLIALWSRQWGSLYCKQEAFYNSMVFADPGQVIYCGQTI
jgi:hypothetical protein